VDGAGARRVTVDLDRAVTDPEANLQNMLRCLQHRLLLLRRDIMCPASARSASEPERFPPMTSTPV
jgi:hypothetical protein